MSKEPFKIQKILYIDKTYSNNFVFDKRKR